MRKPLHPIALALLTAAALLPSSALAQRLAPGLWELQSTMKSEDSRVQESIARMQKELAAMPPEQRKMMQDMMARQGIGIDPAKGMQAMRMCFTKEQVERDELPLDQSGNCRFERHQRSGASIRFAFSCSNPKSSGEGEFTQQGDKAFTSRMTSQAAGKDGKPMRTEMQQQGRWLGADCGGLKPNAGR